MSFRIVLLFMAIIMVSGITDMVDSRYRFPIYYRITRRYDGQSNQMTDKNSFGERIDRGCNFINCTSIPQTPETNVNNEAGEPIGEKRFKILPIIRSRRPNSIYSPASWRAEGNEDKDNWSEQQAQQAIQQFLLKSWRDWNEKSESENGNEDYDQ